MSEYNDGYDAFMDEMERDDRLGKHEVIVASTAQGQWPDGRNYNKVKFAWRNGSHSSIDLWWSDPPDAKTVEAEKATWDSGKRKGIQNQINMRRQLAKHFGKTAWELKEGDVLGINVEARKNKKDGKTYPRVVAFVPVEECQKSPAKSADDIPF